jgi:hypothetical protein
MNLEAYGARRRRHVGAAAMAGGMEFQAWLMIRQGRPLRLSARSLVDLELKLGRI